MRERTLVILKPTAIENRIAGKILESIEDKGLKIAGAKMLWIDRDLAEKHYAEHRAKSFFERLIEHITSKPVMLLAVEGENAIAAMRQLAGATDPLEAEAGSIRGRFGTGITENVIHASDSMDSAKREIELFFKPEELYTY
ncbi:MAG: nucleoside-diphosphate kinase [Candidatus Thermoplasmatota archaeon]|nr:nucleoside-diphosphate kinase [Candidatus Thermoplasmatota archaeon]